jgi:hypothetical protein
MLLPRAAIPHKTPHSRHLTRPHETQRDDASASALSVVTRRYSTKTDTSALLGVKGSQVQILSARPLKALVKGTFGEVRECLSWRFRGLVQQLVQQRGPRRGPGRALVAVVVQQREPARPAPVSVSSAWSVLTGMPAHEEDASGAVSALHRAPVSRVPQARHGLRGPPGGPWELPGEPLEEPEEDVLGDLFAAPAGDDGPAHFGGPSRGAEESSVAPHSGLHHEENRHRQDHPFVHGDNARRAP